MFGGNNELAGMMQEGDPRAPVLAAIKKVNAKEPLTQEDAEHLVSYTAALEIRLMLKDSDPFVRLYAEVMVEMMGAAFSEPLNARGLSPEEQEQARKEQAAASELTVDPSQDPLQDPLFDDLFRSSFGDDDIKFV